MKVTNLAEGCREFTSNVFLCEGNNETVLIDCGADPEILVKIPEHIDKIIITHKHWDHIANLPAVRKRGSPVIYAWDHEFIDTDRTIKDNEKIDICGMKFTILYTPGHIDDAICLYNKEKYILFSGDTVFPAGGFGRTDLRDGDPKKMIESLKKLSAYNINILYPGHEQPTEDHVNDQIKQSAENAELFLK